MSEDSPTHSQQSSKGGAAHPHLNRSERKKGYPHTGIDKIYQYTGKDEPFFYRFAGLEGGKRGAACGKVVVGRAAEGQRSSIMINFIHTKQGFNEKPQGRAVAALQKPSAYMIVV